MTARRQQRTLTQKVRYVSEEDQVQVAETPMADTPTAVQEETASETTREVSADSRENNANIPRRSRRSPRHLRVSGQRRRRYRDERYPQQSPMPLETAAASPEMASGKVWIRYDLQAVPAEAEPQTSVADVAPQAEPQVAAVVASPAEPQVLPEQAAEVAETNAMVAEKHDVDTVTPVSEADVTAVTEETPAVSQTDTEVTSDPVAEEGVAETVVPAEAPQTAQAAAPHAEAEAPSPVQAEVPAPQVAVTEASVETAEPVKAAAPVETTEPVKAAAPVETAEPVKAAAPVKAAVPSDTSVTARYRHATAPMTKAPAPEWRPEPLPHSDWVRPQYAFSGKGSAGGHAATHQATSPVTKTGE